MGYDSRQKMWFGTEDYSTWIRVPSSGAEGGSVGWESGGTLLSGGGFQFGSDSSHREYTFEWSGASSYEEAQEVLDFANGVYGRGLIYFVPPTIYQKNLLPAQWAAPASAPELASFVRDQAPTLAPFSSAALKGSRLPRFTATWDTSLVPAGLRPGESIFIPIPEGFDLALGFLGSTTGSGGVFATPVTSSGGNGATVRLSGILGLSSVTSRPATQWPTVDTKVAGSGLKGVRLWIGRPAGSSSAGSVTVLALSARLMPVGSPALKPASSAFQGLAPIQQVPWTGGMGNSGCRFVGKPTMTLNTGFNGGTAGFAATLREVGLWMNW